MAFINELRRRKVITTTLLYVAASVILLLCVEIVAGIAEMNPHVVDIAATSLVIGIPFVIALAWKYDITAQGVEHTSTHSIKLEWQRVGLPLLAAVLLLFISLSLYALNKGAP